MEKCTYRKLAELVKSGNAKEFKEHIQDLLKFYDWDKATRSEYFLDMMELLNDQEKESAIKWCKEEDHYLLHDLFKVVVKVDSIWFLKNNLAFYKENHLHDTSGQTWLHVAVKYNRSRAILSYLLDEIEVDRNQTDDYDYTVLHVACQKHDYNKGELDLLIKETSQLVARSVDDVTPIELACGNLQNLKDIKRNKCINLNDILSEIDKLSCGLPETEEYVFNERMPTETMWFNLLQKNDKYRLIHYMKEDNKFNEKYYLKEDEIIKIIFSSHENGQGVLTYIKNVFFKNKQGTTLKKLFTELTGLTITETSSSENAENDQVFYKSAIFVALITGRFELVSPLLMYCQFDIIPYGLIVCLICRKLYGVQEFSDQVLKTIHKLKQFCEDYSIAVLNRTTIRDLTPDKKTISGFLSKSEKLYGIRILDIAYLGKCSRFLGLPSCQEALTKQWYERNRRCPFIKFYLHSAFHCLFLGIFSFILVHNIFAQISIIEILCYIYGFGYFAEEARQVYISYKESGFSLAYIKDAANMLDTGAIFFMLLGGVLRMALPIEIFPNQGEQGLYLESKDFNLFFIRLSLCISLILFFMRIIYYGSIFEQLGPKLKMMAKMIISDLMPLIFIFLVFIASFGVAFQSLMFPNSFYTLKSNNTFERKPLSVVISTLFRRSTVTIFDTHFPFEELDHDEGGYVVNNEGRVAVYFLLIVYMVVVNIMLTNLLIALFSNTVTTIIQKSRQSWKANRYQVINEYYYRSILPPPLNIFEILVEMIRVKIMKSKENNKNKRKTNDEEMKMVENDDLSKTQFMSFKILQSFALKDYRYILVQGKADEEYERKLDIKSIKNGINRIEKAIIESN